MLLALLLLIRGLMVLTLTLGLLFITLGLKLINRGLELFIRRGLLDAKLPLWDRKEFFFALLGPAGGIMLDLAELGGMLMLLEGWKTALPGFERGRRGGVFNMAGIDLARVWTCPWCPRADPCVGNEPPRSTAPLSVFELVLP
jgi:hypothetical protein